MKILFLLLCFSIIVQFLQAQDTIRKKETTNKISAYSYFDFPKTGFQPAFWGSYDHNKFTVEARYNYDWDKNISLYLGTVLHYKDWKFRLMQGVTAGNGNTGIGISPLSIYDGKKVFVYNSPQVVFGLTKMPTYFFHWGEIYYKPADWFWVGLSDRVYFDNEKSQDISFGSQVSFAYKEFFLNFYGWLPTLQTENRFSILLGYERSFKKTTNKFRLI